MNDRATLTAADLRRLIAAERTAAPFLLWHAGDGTLQILRLGERQVVVVGRRTSCDLSLASDAQASRTHARLERIGDDWMLLDDGMSRNGSFINGARAQGHCRLDDGDRLRFGETMVEFRDPRRVESTVTSASSLAQISEHLTPTQRRVLVALCRPLRESSPYGIPASNPEIAREVFLGVDAVKAHLRELYRRFDIDLPQNQKRARLAERALHMGLADER